MTIKIRFFGAYIRVNSSTNFFLFGMCFLFFIDYMKLNELFLNGMFNVFVM